MTSFHKKVIKDSIQWDISNWVKSISFWEQVLNKKIKNLKALELGCGENGGLSLWLAYKGYNVVCSGYGSDLDTAKKIHKQYNLKGQIEYCQIDAKSIPAENLYDIICFKSVLGGIIRDNPESGKAVIQQIYKALKPGGYLLFSENLKASKFHMKLRKRYGALKNKWFYFSENDIDNLLEPFSSVQYKTFGFVGCLGRNEAQRRLLSFFDTFVFDKILNKEHHYIISVVAEK